MSAVAFGVLLRVAAPVAYAESPRSPVDNRALIEAMSPAEKMELERKCDRFYGMGKAEQTKLRKLHQQLERHAHTDHLRNVMQRYAEWLKTLPSGQRSELLSLPPQERIAEIKRLMQERETWQMRHFFSREQLADEDLEAIGKWLDDFIAKHEEELLDKVPMFRERISGLSDPAKRRLLLYFGLRMNPRRDLFQPTNEEIGELELRLSEQARQQLSEAREDNRYGELAQAWLRAALYSKRLSPPVDREAMHKYFNEVLDARQREYFESLPPQRMEFELTRMYQAHQLREYFGDDLPSFFGRAGGGFRGRGGGPRPFPDGKKPGGNGGRGGPPDRGKEGGPRGPDRGGETG
jgi:hypothetical protein